eukprot:4476096-Prymnesium_polylepis.1
MRENSSSSSSSETLPHPRVRPKLWTTKGLVKALGRDKGGQVGSRACQTRVSPCPRARSTRRAHPLASRTPYAPTAPRQADGGVAAERQPAPGVTALSVMGLVQPAWRGGVGLKASAAPVPEQYVGTTRSATPDARA